MFTLEKSTHHKHKSIKKYIFHYLQVRRDKKEEAYNTYSELFDNIEYDASQINFLFSELFQVLLIYRSVSNTMIVEDDIIRGYVNEYTTTIGFVNSIRSCIDSFENSFNEFLKFYQLHQFKTLNNKTIDKIQDEMTAIPTEIHKAQKYILMCISSFGVINQILYIHIKDPSINLRMEILNTLNQYSDVLDNFIKLFYEMEEQLDNMQN